MSNYFLNQAISTAVQKEMAVDPKLYLVGEDIISGGGLSVFRGVNAKFPERLKEMPIAELGYCHFANGMAMMGYHCVVDLMFSDFLWVPADAITNSAAKMRFNFQGETSVPVVYVCGNGSRGIFGGFGSGVNHSQCSESWLMNIPGLKIVAPYYPEDAMGLMRGSIRDGDPVVYFYHFGSLPVKQDIVDDDIVLPLSCGCKVRRTGDAVTILALQAALPLAEEAAAELAKEGIEVEVIDPRVLIPFDKKTVLDSVRKTGKLLVAQEGNTRGSWGMQAIAEIALETVGVLKDVKMVGQKNAPIGSGYYEEMLNIKTKTIYDAVKAMV